MSIKILLVTNEKKEFGYKNDLYRIIENDNSSKKVRGITDSYIEIVSVVEGCDHAERIMFKDKNKIDVIVNLVDDFFKKDLNFIKNIFEMEINLDKPIVNFFIKDGDLNYFDDLSYLLAKDNFTTLNRSIFYSSNTCNGCLKNKNLNKLNYLHTPKIDLDNHGGDLSFAISKAIHLDEMKKKNTIGSFKKITY